jgi:hypothetical protein
MPRSRPGETELFFSLYQIHKADNSYCRWTALNTATLKFSAIYNAIERNPPSGSSPDNWMATAQTVYANQTRGTATQSPLGNGSAMHPNGEATTLIWPLQSHPLIKRKMSIHSIIHLLHPRLLASAPQVAARLCWLHVLWAKRQRRKVDLKLPRTTS